MTETEFLNLVDVTMRAIENQLEQATDNGDTDVECSRSGNVLEIEFIENGSKIIINSQAPMQELWVAARSGGFHYARRDGAWVNTRDGSELFVALSQIVSAQGNMEVFLRAE